MTRSALHGGVREAAKLCFARSCSRLREPPRIWIDRGEGAAAVAAGGTRLDGACRLSFATPPAWQREPRCAPRVAAAALLAALAARGCAMALTSLRALRPLLASVPLRRVCRVRVPPPCRAASSSPPASLEAHWTPWARKDRLDERSEVGYSRLCSSSPPDEVVFQERSDCGNGTVAVVRHGPWLALRFDISEQGLSYVGRPDDDDYANGAALPQVLGFDYLRVMAASAAAFTALNGCDLSVPPRDAAQPPPLVLCVGLGAGALPAFLAHGFGAAARVQVAELDPLIVRVVRDVLRVRFALADSPEALLEQQTQPSGAAAGPDAAPFTVAQADGLALVASLAEEVAAGRRRGASLLVLDAYEQNGRIPQHLREPAFLEAAAACLAPEGVIVANLFNGPPNSSPRKEMALYARMLAGATGGPVFSVKVQTQQTNVVLVAARPDSALGRDGVSGRDVAVAAARRVARNCAGGPWEFDAGSHVERMFALKIRPGGVVETVPGRIIDFPKESSAADFTYATE